MSAFQIDLRELDSGPVEKQFRLSQEQLEEFFSIVEDDFQARDHEAFVADLRAQKTDSTIHVTGHVHGDFVYDCGRCLSARELEVDTDVDFVLMSELEWTNAYGDEEEIALSEEDMDISYYEGDVVDLASLIREAVLLELPAFPQCPESMRSECDRLYEERVGDDTLEELEDQKVDLRWSALKNLEVTDSGEVKEIDDDED